MALRVKPEAAGLALRGRLRLGVGVGVGKAVLVRGGGLPSGIGSDLLLFLRGKFLVFLVVHGLRSFHFLHEKGAACWPCLIYPCIPSTIHSSTISQKFISYSGCRLLNHNVALQLSQSDKSTATYPPIPEPNIPKVVGR